MKKRLVVLLSAIMLTMALTGCGVKVTNDTVIHEAGQELNIDATAYFNVDEEKAQEFVFDTSAVDVNKVGEYEAIATYKHKEFTLKVNVVDTTAPMVEFAHRCIFTNDLVDTDITGSLEGIYDASEYTTKLIRFEYVGNLEVMDENAVKELTDKIPVPCDADELMEIGTEEVPTEPGIYRSVLEIKDAYDNLVLEEVYVVYDTTGAKIEDVADKTVRVEKEDLDKEPEIDKSDYTITDNVDGKIKSDDIVCELELRDQEKHEWLVHVSYTDRAGNESKADFLIIVKEQSNSSSKKDNSSSNGTTSSSGSTGSTNAADADGDGVVTGEEAAANISPQEQAVINAGYGIVVDFGDGSYGVMTYNNGCVNGVNGADILINYLFSRGLFANNITGGLLATGRDDYMYVATNVVAIPSVPSGDASTGGGDYTVDDDGWIN